MFADIIAILGIAVIAIGLLLMRRSSSTNPALTGKLLIGGGAVAFAVGLVLNFME